MTREGYCFCLKCHGEGVMYKRCGTCDGTGLVGPASECPTCGAQGELADGTCDLCGGEKEITVALGRLYEADRYVSANEPEWDGDSLSRPGITQYGLAQWYRSRKQFGRVVRVATFRSPWTQELEVQLYNERDEKLMLSGLGWGYGGEGPHGLAVILADGCPRFEGSVEAAMKFVGNQKWGSRWTLDGLFDRSAEPLDGDEAVAEVERPPKLLEER